MFIKKLTNTIQKRFNASSTQLLYQSAPFQAAILFVSGPVVDQLLTNRNVFSHKYSPLVLVQIHQNQFPSSLSDHNISNLIQFSINADIYNPIMPYIRVSQLQHVSCHRKDFTGYIPSFGSSQNMSCFRLWVHITS